MDAHFREGNAAVAAMQETYGGPRFSPSKPVPRDGRIVDTWAVGDYVPFTTPHGDHRQGYILEVIEVWPYDEYHIKSHRIGGGEPEHFIVDGFKIHVF